MILQRRNYLLGTGAVAMALIASRAFGQGAAATCYDPASLPPGQAELRESLEYIDVSTDPARRCDHCAFASFENASCGSCQIFSGGPISPGGVCSSFSAQERPAKN